jgi:hypothetical protein
VTTDRRRRWSWLASLLLVAATLGGAPARAAEPEPGDPPVPVVTGTAQYGHALGVATGEWPLGASLTYQWLREGAPIAGATAPSYPIVVGDVGTRLSVRVSGTWLLGSGSRVSEPTAPVAPGTPVVGRVRIAGTPKVGRSLFARPAGFARGADASFGWYVGSRLVGRSTELRLTRDLAGRTVVLRVSVTQDGYAATGATSAPVKVAKLKKPRKKGRGRG